MTFSPVYVKLISCWQKLHIYCTYMPLSLVYLESRCRVEALYNLSVVKKTVGSVSDGNHTAAAAVDVNAVHVSEGQADMCG